MFAFISFAFNFIGTVMAIRTAIVGITTGDLRKAIVGGVGAAMGFNSLQSSAFLTGKTLGMDAKLGTDFMKNGKSASDAVTSSPDLASASSGTKSTMSELLKQQDAMTQGLPLSNVDSILSPNTPVKQKTTVADPNAMDSVMKNAPNANTGQDLMTQPSVKSQAVDKANPTDKVAKQKSMLDEAIGYLKKADGESIGRVLQFLGTNEQNKIAREQNRLIREQYNNASTITRSSPNPYLDKLIRIQQQQQQPMGANL